MCALDTRPFRRDFPSWGWALGGAVAVPAVVLAASAWTRFPALAVLCLLISAIGIGAGGAATAVRRGDPSWKAAAIIWLVAYTAGAATYASWPERSERLAQPGEVNEITLPQAGPDDDVFGETGFGVSDNDVAFLERTFAGLIVFGVVGGGLNARRVVSGGRRFRSAVATGAAWALGSTLLLPVLLVIGIYATHLLGELFKPLSEPLGLSLGWLLTGMTCGLLVGTIGESTLDRFLPVVGRGLPASAREETGGRV